MADRFFPKLKLSLEGWYVTSVYCVNFLILQAIILEACLKVLYMDFVKFLNLFLSLSVKCF